MEIRRDQMFLILIKLSLGGTILFVFIFLNSIRLQTPFCFFHRYIYDLSIPLFSVYSLSTGVVGQLPGVDFDFFKKHLLEGYQEYFPLSTQDKVSLPFPSPFPSFALSHFHSLELQHFYSFALSRFHFFALRSFRALAFSQLSSRSFYLCSILRIFGFIQFCESSRISLFLVLQEGRV